MINVIIMINTAPHTNALNNFSAHLRAALRLNTSNDAMQHSHGATQCIVFAQSVFQSV
jgi:hypothetical protein